MWRQIKPNMLVSEYWRVLTLFMAKTCNLWKLIFPIVTCLLIPSLINIIKSYHLTRPHFVTYRMEWMHFDNWLHMKKRMMIELRNILEIMKWNKIITHHNVLRSILCKLSNKRDSNRIRMMNHFLVICLSYRRSTRWKIK